MKAFSSDIPALFHPERVNQGETVHLDPEESRHVRALRLRSGDQMQLLDGAGNRAFGRLQEEGRGSFLVRVERTVLEEEDPGAYIGLGIGLLSDKGRMEWLIEKSVELGVRGLYPLQSQRAEGFFREDRARRVAIAALKQSQRTWLPEISGPLDWEEIAGVLQGYDAVMLCHEGEDVEEDVMTRLDQIKENERIFLLIGPEGGFSEEEVKRGRDQYNATIVSLGSTRLRAETAAIVALAAIQLRAFKVQNSKRGRE